MDEVNEFTAIFRYFLLVFAGIALFVGAFVIFNTFSITVAQRTREFATLRTIGASRRQVLGSVILESLVIGLLASLIGLALGVLLAEGIEGLFRALGVELPTADRVFAARTVIVALAVGVGITLAGGAVPRDQGDPGASDRGGPGRCDAPEVPVRAVRALDRRARDRRRARDPGPRDVHGRARHGRSPALDRGGRPAAVPRRRDARVARRASARRGQQPDRPLGRVRLHRPVLAVLAPPVLAPALRSVGAGNGCATRGRLRRRRAPQPAAPADRPRHVAATGGDVVGAGVADGVPQRRPGSRGRSHGRRERPQEPEPDGGDCGGADDRDRARRRSSRPSRTG